MAHFIQANGTMRHNIPVPLSLTALQQYVQGFVQFIDLSGGDCIAVNEKSAEYGDANQTATALAFQPICGPAVLFHPGELE